MYLPSLYLATVLIWGTSWFAIKFQLGTVAPELSLVYRFGIASVLLLAFCFYRGYTLRLGIRNHCFVALQGACLFSINYLIFYHATGLLTSGLVAIVFSSVMFMNMFNGWVFLRRRVSPLVVLGACFGLGGIILVFWPELSDSMSTPEVQRATQRGLVLSLVATYFASLGNILSARNQQSGISVISANALGMGYGAFLMLVFVMVRGTPINFDFSPAYIGSLAYLVLFASILAFGAYLTLVGELGSDRADYATVLFPIVSLVLSSLF